RMRYQAAPRPVASDSRPGDAGRGNTSGVRRAAKQRRSRTMPGADASSDSGTTTAGRVGRPTNGSTTPQPPPLYPGRSASQAYGGAGAGAIPRRQGPHGPKLGGG